jgi:uncharacterized membrane protein
LRIGLGTLQLARPRVVARLSGLDDTATTRRVLALVGARKLVQGVGLVGRRTPGWAWTRVAGDAMDLAALGIALARRPEGRRRALAGVTGAVLAVTAVDMVAALRAGRTSLARRIELTASTTVRRPRSEVYAFWRRLENLPTFMAHLDAVVSVDERHSRWWATAPFGRTVAWDAEVTHDMPDSRIAWRSTGRATVPNAGSVRFVTAPDGVSTEVRVRLTYALPGGRLGAAVARYFGEEPRQQVDDDLRRFKQVMETGEVVRSDGLPSGKRARHEFPQRPAQPPRLDELAEVMAV